MCGIWALISAKKITNYGAYYDLFMKTKHRGPDNSRFELINDNVMLGFHRLAIMDLTVEGNQPFHHVRPDGSCVYCICNGEIYDFEQIKKDHNITTISKSDCEIIIPLYEKVGICEMVKILGSEFAFIIVDINPNGKTLIHYATDPYGARPLFFATDNNGTQCFSSEMKSLTGIFKSIYRISPGVLHIDEYINNVNKSNMLIKIHSCYYDKVEYNIEPPKEKLNVNDIEFIYNEIQKRFINCVKKRMHTNRPIGALLSGGLDSSLVCGVMKMLNPGLKFPVFTIAFTTGSTDLPYAKKVAEFLDLQHYVIEVNPYDALKEIDETIYAIESYDITTVRASVVQRIIAKYIEKNTNIKVLLCGENSDEVFQGYKYYHNQPSDIEGYKDSVSRVSDVHLFDGLRTDRTMAYHGLEVRLPFIDPEIVDFAFRIPPELVRPLRGFEKTILRDSFKNLNILPEDVLYRSKEALSDGCSGKSKSWFEYIQEHIDNIVSDEEYQMNNVYEHCKPISKESYYYRKKFVGYFGNSDEVAQTIPYFWMPKWCPETNDPSARTLNVYP